jgi:peptide/nickel transport system substrate-binding protein
VIALFVAMTFSLHSVGDELSLEAWPESWMEPAVVASVFGVAEFAESPVSSDLVLRGLLPPVEERLPEDPPVIEPFDSIGQYGGIARVFVSDWDKFNPAENPLTIDPTASKIFPNYIRRWEISDDAREVTFTLHEGLKWSDGHPLTADDFVFHHQHVMLNKELSPVVFPDWRGSESEKLDQYTVRFRFREPFPLLINVMAQLGDFFVSAKHFMKDFHPTFTDRELLIARARDEGYISWMGYFNAVRGWTRNNQPLTPTLRPYRLVRKTPTTEFYERNHFYWKVDTSGNQLPYIDEFRAEVIENQDVLAAKAATGQVDFASFELKTQDFPLFKLGERTAGIKVHVWNRIHGSDVLIQPNLTIDDQKLRSVFQDHRFRKALSVAINRDEMNSIIYFDRGVPRQATVIPTSRFYESEFAKAYTQFDPVQAGAWLDEMGMVDSDDDGFREYPDGEEFTLTLEYLDFETPKRISLELVTAYWRDIGLDIRLKEVDPALQTRRAEAGLMQMTVWHADRTTDILFPFQPQWYVPMRIGWEESHWNEWSRYFLSEGQRGEKPPPEIAQLQSWWQSLRRSNDPALVTALGKKILKSSAENVWTIGTVGLAPQPVVVSHRLKNVPTMGFWGWDNRWTMPYHASTWYLEE